MNVTFNYSITYDTTDVDIVSEYNEHLGDTPSTMIGLLEFLEDRFISGDRCYVDPNGSLTIAIDGLPL